MPQRLALLGLTALLLAGCSDQTPPDPSLPTPVPSGSVPLTADVYALHPADLPGDMRQAHEVVTADSLARDNGDPASPPPAVRYAGLRDGVRSTFTRKGLPADPALLQVISEVFLFDTTDHATQFFAAERARRARPVGGVTPTPVTGLPAAGLDDLFALAEPVSNSDPAQTAYLAAMRHGTTVVELVASGPSDSVTVPKFTVVFAVQRSRLLG